MLGRVPILSSVWMAGEEPRTSSHGLQRRQGHPGRRALSPAASPLFEYIVTRASHGLGLRRGLMSAMGQKRTSERELAFVCFVPKADVLLLNAIIDLGPGKHWHAPPTLQALDVRVEGP